MTDRTDYKLLIVDDDRATQALVKAVLTKEGFTILTASDGAAGVQRYIESAPDIVLMDVMMPVMNGFEATRQIRALDREEGIPIIMLTGADDIEAISAAFEAGATDFMTKPISWPLLSQRIRFSIRSGQLMRESRRSRMRESALRHIAQLGFWSWDPITQGFQWPEDIAEVVDAERFAAPDLQSLIATTHPDDRERVLSAFTSAAAANLRIELEFRVQLAHAERILRFIGERGTEGRDMDRFFGAIQNVTDTRQAQALVDYLALHDELTGLGNRRLFSQAIVTQSESLTRGSPGVILVGWVDLTRFHRFNDSLGEQTGDMLLQQIAQRLRALVGDGEVARVGGDEFGILLRANDSEEANDRFKQILAALERPFKAGSEETYISTCAGFSIFPDDADKGGDMLTLAQEAQRQARAQGRNICSALEQGTSRTSSSLEMERDLRRALDRGEFHLVYQPQMNLREGRIVGVEALLRWQHPQKGLISPLDFIPTLEETGQIIEIGAWVIAEACRQAKRWQQAGTPLRVGINLSPRQFQEPSLLDTIIDATQKNGVRAELIELEITESLAMQDPERAITLLQMLRDSGYKIAIDDFGIGHSSLEYLLRFPLDSIKIDRSFVTRITSIQANRTIIRAITAIGQTLGASTIAEGVETLRECDFIEALGVNEIQGYLIGKAMHSEELASLIQDFRRPGEIE